VPCLDEGRDQLNERFPHRDKASDGSIGDAAHQAETSSHNPDDESGVSAEWDDHDGIHEIRARDYDKDLNDPDVTAEDVVQFIVKMARNGTFWWIRYIIFNGRIWHERDGFVTHAYTGASKHTEHWHITSTFSEAADTVTGTNWQFQSLTKKGVVHTPSKPPVLDVDGALGPKTIARWQQIMKTNVDGKIDGNNSPLIRAVQTRLNALHVATPALKVDGQLGPRTIGALQRYLKSPVDQFISKPKSQMVIALQRRLNTGKF
jgi:hypothetical protein